MLTKPLNEFLASIQHLARNTQYTYKYQLNLLLEYCEQEGIESWADLDSKTLRAFLGARHRGGVSGRTIKPCLSAVRRFYTFLAWKHNITIDPSSGIIAPKHAKKLPHYLDEYQMERLLDIEMTSPLHIRDKAIMELLYSSGLRVSELANLDLDDLDLADGMVLVNKGKGNKDRYVPVGSKAIEALKAWLKERGEMNTPALFVDYLYDQRESRLQEPAEHCPKCNGKSKIIKTVRYDRYQLPTDYIWRRRKCLECEETYTTTEIIDYAISVRFKEERITPRGIQIRMNYWGDKQGLGKVTPHMLRHSCATHFLNSSNDIRATQELLGHTSVSTTMIYTHVSLDRITEVYRNAHPRGRKKTAQETFISGAPQG